VFGWTGFSTIEIAVVGEQPDIVEDMSALIEDWKFEELVFCRLSFRTINYP